jgi:hypothetical protein
VTLFVRPSMGAIHEKAIPKPKDPIAAAIVAQLAPAGKKRDWQGFYGIGYGFDINLTNHFGIRTQGDLVWDHLFNDLLAQGRWTTRFSVGPCFNFGRAQAVPLWGRGHACPRPKNQPSLGPSVQSVSEACGM